MRITFQLIRSISTLAGAISFAATCAAAEIVPEALSVDSNGRAVAVTRYAAEGAASRPAVLVLPGSGGIEDSPETYARHALALAESGLDAYLVRYSDSNWPGRSWDLWARTVDDVATAVLQRPEASGRVGLLGFSLGGAVAVISARDPRIAALVVFYGFIPHNERARTGPLPPLLVLHGDTDADVPLQSGEDLVRMARQSGGRAELVVYPGEKHRYATWGEQSATDAIHRTIAFFRAELIGH
jgi:carboxymethylenebutenolidase